MIRFLHTADLHLDAKFSSLDRDKRLERRRSLKKQLTLLVDIAIDRSVDIVAVAGDLFDSPNPTRETVGHVLSEFGRLRQSGIACFVIPGNHDYYIPGGLWDDPAWEAVATVITESKWRPHALESLGLVMHGIACTAINSDTEVLAGLKPVDGGVINVAMLHGSQDRRYFRGERCYPFDAAIVDDLPVDFLCLGHYHSHSLVGTSGRAAYSGSPEGLDFAETGQHYCLIVEIDKGPTKVTPVATGALKTEEVEIDCTNISASSQVSEILRPYAGGDTLLRASLTGAIDPRAELDPAEIMAEVAAEFFHLEVVDRTLVGDFSLAQGNSVQSRFVARMQALAESADENDQHIVALATRYGLAALSGKGKK